MEGIYKPLLEYGSTGIISAVFLFVFMKQYSFWQRERESSQKKEERHAAEMSKKFDVIVRLAQDSTKALENNNAVMCEIKEFQKNCMTNQLEMIRNVSQRSVHV